MKCGLAPLSIVIAYIFVAAAPSTRTVTETSAKDQYRQAIRKATEACQAAMKKADDTYQAQLKADFNIALESKDLATANRLDAEIKKVQNKHSLDLPDLTDNQSEFAVARRDLSSNLANSKWAFGSAIMCLNADGTGLSPDRPISWSVVSEDQIVVRWPSNDFDIFTFDKDRKSFTKDWLGRPAGQPRDRLDAKRVE